MEAYYSEIRFIETVGGVKTIPNPDNIEILSILELFDLKYDVITGKFKHKVRIVVRGDKEANFIAATYAPVASGIIIKLNLALLTIMGYLVRQLDIKTAFLNARRSTLLHTYLPLGHKDRKKGFIWSTYCTIYGLKDAPRKWYLLLKSILDNYGLVYCPLDPCLFSTSDKSLILILYVDDMVYFAKNSSILDKFESYLQKHLTIKITETLTKYVGHELEVSNNKTKISVQGYIKACLERFDWTNIKERKYPGNKGFKIINPDSPLLVDKSKFLSVLGCLNYISSIARPDIAFTTNFLARNSSSLREDHMELAKQVFQYLKFSGDKGIDYYR